MSTIDASSAAAISAKLDDIPVAGSHVAELQFGHAILVGVIVIILIFLAVVGSFRRNRKSHLCLRRNKVEYLVDQDVSNGREKYEVPAISYLKHDETPLDFHYVTDHVQRESGIQVDVSLTSMGCCQCVDDCATNNDCACSKGAKCQRFYDSEGRLSLDFPLDSPEMIRECNMACRCNRKSCKNMVIQRGCQARLVLFRTKSRGWGVRTLDNLARGTFVGVYSGELVPAISSQRREDDTYLFNLSNHHPFNTATEKEEKEEQAVESTAETRHDCCEVFRLQQQHLQQQQQQQQLEHPVEGEIDMSQAEEDGGNAVQEPSVNDEKRPVDGQQVEEVVQMDEDASEGHQKTTGHEEVLYVCDAKYYGNFTRFINHSCDPNVIGIRAFTTHQDERFPQIAFFTNQDIPANTELTLNYGDSYWLVKCKRDKVYCLCNRSKCKFNKKTLPATMKQYKWS